MRTIHLFSLSPHCFGDSVCHIIADWVWFGNQPHPTRQKRRHNLQIIPFFSLMSFKCRRYDIHMIFCKYEFHFGSHKVNDIFDILIN